MSTTKLTAEAILPEFTAPRSVWRTVSATGAGKEPSRRSTRWMAWFLSTKKEATEARRTTKGKMDRKAKNDTEAASVMTFLPLKLRRSSRIFMMTFAMSLPYACYYTRLPDIALHPPARCGIQRRLRVGGAKALG